MIHEKLPRPSLAVAALWAILAITAAWWALALWPLDAAAPDWVARTREICFGATHTGLPHAGGWLLLIGEPIGMFGVLYVVWGRELREGLARFHRQPIGRMVSTVVVLLGVVGVTAAGWRVAESAGSGRGEPFALSARLPRRSAEPAPALVLLDQRGVEMRLESMRGRWVMVTFAFGHCDDICPVIVEHARRAREDEGAGDVPIWVVTLDPWRDTPDRLPSIAVGWGLEHEDRVLGGGVETVNATLDEWGIARQRDSLTGFVAHPSTIVLVDPEGRAAWRIEGAPQRVREALAIAIQG